MTKTTGPDANATDANPTRRYTTDFCLNGDNEVALEAEFASCGLKYTRKGMGQGHPTYTLEADENTLVAYLTSPLCGMEPTGPNNTWEWDD